MIEKEIIVFYNMVRERGYEIWPSDYDKFFKKLWNSGNLPANVRLRPEFCPDEERLLDAIRRSINDNRVDELYFHFSGHGTKDGLAFPGTVLPYQKLAETLNHRKIRFCFFANCHSTFLANATSKLNIPTVIGAHEAIDNDFSIQFQKQFYDFLIAKKSFRYACTQTLLLSSSNSQPQHEIITHRGAGSSTEELSKDSFFIIERYDEDSYLIQTNYIETIYEHFQTVNSQKDILFLFSTSEHLQENVLNKLEALDYSHSHHIVTLDLEKLQILQQYKKQKKGHIDYAAFINEIFTTRVKLLLICNDAIQNDSRILLQTLFDNEKWVAATSASAQKHHKIKILHKTEFGLSDLSRFLGTNSEMGKKIHRYDNMTVAYTKNIEEVFNDDSFRRFLDESEIDFTVRYEGMFDINCKPLSEKLTAPRTPEDFFNVFSSKFTYKDLTHFLIHYERMRTRNYNLPLIINMDENLNQLLEKECKKLNIRLVPASTNAHIIETIIQFYPTFFLIRSDNKEEKDKLLTVIDAFNEAISEIKKKKGDGALDAYPEKYTYLFVILSDDWDEAVLASHYKHRLTIFGTPDPLTAATIEAWHDLTQRRNMKFAMEIMNKIIIPKSIVYSEYRDKCPSEILKIIADILKIPHKQLFNT